MREKPAGITGAAGIRFLAGRSPLLSQPDEFVGMMWSDFGGWRRSGNRSGNRLLRHGSADEQKPAADGTVEAWGRAESNPVGGSVVAFASPRKSGSQCSV